MTDGQVFIGIGSNLEDPAAQVRRAFEALDRLPASTLLRASSLYRTAPWGLTRQPDFINAVAELATSLDPEDLLAALKALECSAGRTRRERWGPRVLDLDLLAFRGLRLETPGLVLPHPRIPGRSFVLVPWSEIAPDFEVPGMGRVDALLARCEDPSGQAPEKLEREACTAPATITAPN